MKTDSLFYRLFQRMPGLALELAGLDYDAEGYVFRSEEIKQTAFRLDGILVPPANDPSRPYVFAEVQFQPDDGFYARFFSEIFLYLRQYKPPHPWKAVVIYAGRAVERFASPHFLSLLELPEVRRVYLEDFSEIIGDSPTLSLISLLLCPPEQALEQTRRSLALTAPLPRDEWLDFIETILAYKLPKLTREEIKQMIGLQDIDLKQTRFYQDVFGEGRQEGRQEGRREGELAIVLRLLERRFGSLPDTLEKRLRQLEMERLEALSEALLDMRSLDELNDWLALRGLSG